ncbi:DNA repair protein RecN [Peptoniphilus catoniae]|uniref:DNA repair protein RecN n=1 Tax=Peptoniphilus catoniae TaxID=1660341 RepID=UPI0010FD0067|nr:DNA repair protein RecN [Peptoniphilus catoniae]
MLLELTIKNFAIIEDLQVEFSSGLNVLTGETGSGKSIIIDALSMVLGDRASKDIIKKGKDFAYIEAIFTNYSERLSSIFKENNIEMGDLIVISRDIRQDRPSITKVNGRTVPASILVKITDKLIDIFAQNENTSLMSQSNQRDLIDSFGSAEHKNNLSLLEIKVKGLNRLIEEFQEKSKSTLDKDREIDLLKYQIEEIEDANLTDKDDSDLEERYRFLNNISGISNNIQESVTLLKSSYENISIEDMMDKLISLITEILDTSKDLEPYYNELEDIRYRLKEVSHSLESYLNSIDYSEEDLVNLESRINLVNNLKKKYGNSVNDIYKYLDKTKSRYEFLNNYEKEMKSLEDEISKEKNECLKLAKKMSEERKSISKKFEEKIQKELIELNIKNAEFKVEFREKPLSQDGIDDMEFMIVTNIGEDFKPLSKIASGGEMSRVMLAFKSILAEKDEIQTLVFDEIDSGISGITAQIVGNKIKKISNCRQVIAISHLPQIVSVADSHYVIEKFQDENKVISNIRKLSRNDRIKELARLIGGINITQTALKAAEEMLTKEGE